MKNCNDNHLQKANQGSNINKMGDKMNVNIFNSKRLRKSCYRFLSSIVTLSILSVANSSFAFPAQVRGNHSLYLFYRPFTLEEASERIPIEQKLQKLPRLLTYLTHYTLVDVLYCRASGWCYISGYYSQGAYFPVKAWALSTNICDQRSDDFSNPLPYCLSPTGSTELEAIKGSGKKFDQFLFFCSSPPDQNGKTVYNPLRGLLETANPNFCNPPKQ